MGNQALGLRIKKARLAQGMTQKELADAIGVSRGAVSMWESGANEPTLQMLQALTHILGVRYEILIFGEEEARKRVPVAILNKFGGDVEAALDYMDAQTAFKDDEHDPEHDVNVDHLEALHQNPKLGLLFDRSRKMSEKDIDFMIAMADRIMKEDEEN